MWPPCSPAPGPMSTTQSAVRMVSSSCSTTISVLPRFLEPDQRLDQPVVVALVQADARLVEHVEHTDQARSDLGGQPDALRLAAGQRARRPVQREVVEADVDQEPQPRVDLLEHPLGDHLLPVGQAHPAEQVGAIPHGQRTHVGDAAPVERHREDLGLEPRPAARAAGHVAHVALVFVARPVALGVTVPALDPLHHALEAGVVGPLAPVFVAVADVHLVLGAVEDRLLPPRRQRPPRSVEVEALLVAERLEQPQEVFERVPGRPRRDRALAQRALGVGHDQLGVDLFLGADAGAVGTSAIGRVERERPGLEVLDRQRVIVGAREVLGEAPLPVLVVLGQIDELENDHALGELERGLDGVGEPLLGRAFHREPVDDHLDGVLLLLLELGRLGQRVDDAVDPGPRVALGLQVGEQVDVFALAAPDDGRQHLEPGALLHRQHPVDNLLRRLLGDQLATHRAVRLADARIEQPEIVVDLGDRADRRARIARRRLLVDRHRRREALDEVDVGLVHLTQELPRVRRQRLDVTPLTLGENRVEGQARLPRAGQPGEHDHGVARQVEVDVTQIVLACSTDGESVGHRSL